VIEFNLIITIKQNLLMKKLLIILLSIVIINDTIIAQNTLDKLGLSSSTPAAAAYSLRLLSTSYTGAAIKVRRSSDDATQDIGFTAGGDLDEAALLSFTGSANGYVSIWFDQSGNARDMVKGDVNQQPQIVFSGAFKYIGSRIAIDFAGSKGLVFDGSLKLYSVSTVIKSESTVWPDFHTILDGSPRIGGILTNNGTNFWQDVPQIAIWKNGIAKTNTESLSPVDEGMVLSFSSQTSTVSRIFIGNYDAGGSGGSILENEAVAFASLISSSDRQVVECSQGAYYNIATVCTTLINTQPSAIAHAACLSSTAAPLSVDASGLNLTYQWYSNSTAVNSGGSPISGATSSSFTPSTSAIGTAYYYVEITGSVGGMVTSSVSGAITVDAPPTVSISPASATIHSGDSITLTASGASSYVWGTDSKTPLDQVSGYRLAIGLRQLRSSYTGPAIRLRRGSDNAESNFGFIGSELDIASISSFLGASSGYCTTLFDQSGSGNDVIQTGASNQPSFVATGLNGKPVLHFIPGQSMYNTTNFSPPYSVVYGARQTGPARGRVLSGLYNNWLLGWWNGSKSQAYFDGWVSTPGGNSSDNNAFVYSSTGTGGISTFYENGTQLYSNNGGVNGPNGLNLNGVESSDADIAEIFIFNTVLADADRELIENSSGAYYGIFGSSTPGDNLVVKPTVTTTYNVIGSSVNGGCDVAQTAIITVLDNPNLSNFISETKIYFDGSYTINAPTTNSTGAFTFISSNTGVATIIANTVTIVGEGVTTIKAVQAATSTHFGDSISATLTVTKVMVVTKHGEVSNSNFNYVSKNGAIGAKTGLTKNGESTHTNSSGDGLSAGKAGNSAYQIKQDYPASTDGFYWISNPNINGGNPFQIYADMTTDGGGWTLILCNVAPNPGWSNAEAILRNENSPSISSNYSIIAWADYIKKSGIGFQYMIDAQSRRSYGGIWTANDNYSFVSTSNTNTNITLNTKFGSWNYNGSGIEERMPWYAPGSQGLITTSGDANGDWWGTLVAAGGWTPAPWLGCCGMGDPGIIWYWVR
jgi:hypothetical protein